MGKVESIEIQCEHCEAWFPSPIGFGNPGGLDASLLEGNLLLCGNCGEMTSCNKENMRVRTEDGGFMGDSTT